MQNHHDLIYILLTSLVYSLIEIELEGKNGWMTKIPTAKIFNMGGKHMTLYHLYMIIMITLSVVYQNNMEYNINSFLYSASYVFLFLLLEDFLWFVYNPYFTINKYKKEEVWWHANQPWIYGIPLHNFIVAGINLLISYYTGFTDIAIALVMGIAFSLISILLSPFYHKFYKKVHKFDSN